MTQEEERELILKAQAGDRSAAARLMKTHDGFWRLLAGQARTCRDETYDDALQEVRMVAFQTLATFNVKHGTRFITYAGQRVKWHLLTRRHTLGIIRTPHGHNLKKISPDLQAQANRVRHPLGADHPEVNWNDNPDRGPGPVEESARREEFQLFRDAVGKLQGRQADVVRYRLQGMTLAGAGRQMGLTKERVRQIELLAHARLRRLVGVPPVTVDPLAPVTSTGV